VGAYDDQRALRHGHLCAQVHAPRPCVRARMVGELARGVGQPRPRDTTPVGRAVCAGASVDTT
jgi:hypothetical protein